MRGMEEEEGMGWLRCVGLKNRRGLGREVEEEVEGGRRRIEDEYK
jgi:hypothetical protein